MAIKQLSKGSTVELDVRGDGLSDVVQVIGNDVRGIIVQYGPGAVGFSATAVELLGTLDGAAGTSPGDALSKQLDADISSGSDVLATEVLNFFWCNVSGYSSGRLRVLIKALG